jgi:hypothetical protein
MNKSVGLVISYEVKTIRLVEVLNCYVIVMRVALRVPHLG